MEVVITVAIVFMRHYVLGSSVHPSVRHYQTWLMQCFENGFDANWHYWSVEQEHETINFWGHGVTSSKVEVSRGHNRSQNSLSVIFLKSCPTNFNQTWQALRVTLLTTTQWQTVKVTRKNIDLKACWRHRFRPLGSSSFSGCM